MKKTDNNETDKFCFCSKKTDMDRFLEISLSQSKKRMESDFYLDLVPAPTKFGRLPMYAILKWPIT